MNPRPDIEWAKRTLEELNVRVVNDKPGRRKLDDVAKGIRDAKRRRLASQSSGAQRNQPTLHQPILHQPTLHQPMLHQPTLHQPTLHQPRLEDHLRMQADHRSHSVSGVTNLSYANGFERIGNRRSFTGPDDRLSSLANRDRGSFLPTQSYDTLNRSLPENQKLRLHNSGYQPIDEIRDNRMPRGGSGSSSVRFYHHLQNHLDYLLEELRQTNNLLGMYRIREREGTLLRTGSIDPLHVTHELSAERSRDITNMPPLRQSSNKPYAPMYIPESEQYKATNTIQSSLESDGKPKEIYIRRRYSMESYEPQPSVNLLHSRKEKTRDLDVSAADSLLLMQSRKDSDCSASSPHLIGKAV